MLRGLKHLLSRRTFFTTFPIPHYAHSFYRHPSSVKKYIRPAKMSQNEELKEGDSVSWKWGAGQPSGTVAEIQTEGKLEIETKGKKVHKNADPENPAVHVEREGNDVVKRASELTKEKSAEPAGNGEETATPKEGAASQNEDAEMKDATSPEKEEAALAAEANEETASSKHEDEKKDADDTVGEAEQEADKPADKKRERSQSPGRSSSEAVPKEQEDAEKETGKEAKKARIDLEEEVPETPKEDDAQAAAKESASDKDQPAQEAEGKETPPVSAETPKDTASQSPEKAKEETPEKKTSPEKGSPAKNTRSKSP